MYSNSKEQISLEEAYRMVHLNEETEETESHECECGGEEECNCNDHTDMCDECHRPVDKCDCGKYSKIKEALDFGTVSDALKTVFMGFQEMWHAFTTTSGPESFHDKIMFWITPAIITAAVAGIGKAGEAVKSRLENYYKNLDKKQKEENIKFLLKHEEIRATINKIIQNQEKDIAVHQIVNDELAKLIEHILKQKDPETPRSLMPPAFALAQHGGAFGGRKNPIA